MNQTTHMPTAWPPGRVARATLLVLAVLLGALLLYRFRLVVFSLFIAIVIATALVPAADWLQKRGLKRGLAIAIIFTVITLLFAGFLFLVVPIISEQGATMARVVGNYYLDFRQALGESDSIVLRRISWRLPVALPLSLDAAAAPTAPAEPGASFDTVGQALTIANSVAKGIFAFIAVVLLTFYWTLDRDRILRWFFLLFPQERRDSVRVFVSEIEDKVGAYFRGVSILSLVIGSASLIAYLIIGLPNALLLGVIAGVMEAVPLIGPILGAVPALAVALAFDQSKIIWIIVATMIIQFAENNLLVPRVMDRAVGINPIVSLLAFAAFSTVFGLAGALLAIPLAVIVQLLVKRFLFQSTSVAQPAPAGRDYVSLLRYEAQELIQDVRKQVRQKEDVVDDVSDQVEDAIEAIVNDLDSILAKVETQQQAAQEEKPA